MNTKLGQNTANNTTNGSGCKKKGCCREHNIAMKTCELLGFSPWIELVNEKQANIYLENLVKSGKIMGRGRIKIGDS